MKTIPFLLCALLLLIVLQQPLQAQSWLLTGNSGTNPDIQFLGTTNDKALVLRTKNIERLRILGAGNIGIGTTAPVQKLDVNGNINIAKGSSLYTANNRVFTVDVGTQFLPRGNLFVGISAGNSNTEGTHNNAFGYKALYFNTTGVNNCAYGSQALYSNINGFYNTASGYRALYSNLSGFHNTAYGHNALYSNTNGYYNTAYGVDALYSNTTGYYNTAFGIEALYSNTDGNNNTAVGYGALFYNNGHNNTAFGFSTLRINSTGYENSAFGDQALLTNSIGYGNTAVGFHALYSNTEGIFNTAIGKDALYSNTEGNSNIAIGHHALFKNTIGRNNTASGINALNGNLSGIYNTAYGTSALNSNTTGNYNTACGVSALASNSTGNYNTACGYSTLSHDSKFGNNNTVIGSNATISNTDFPPSNATAIGNGAMVLYSNQIRIGNTGITSIGGYQNWTNFSDGRYKKNVKDNVPGLVFIKELKPVTYTLDIIGLDTRLYKDVSKTDKEGKSLHELTDDDKKARTEKEKIVYTGFVAQEVEKAAKKLAYDFSGVDAPPNDNGVYGLRYAEFVVPLVKAVQELSKINDENDAKIDNLEKRLITLEHLLITQNNSSITNSSSAYLKQNISNPANNSTTISYNLPYNISHAHIAITDMKGNALKTFSVNKGAGQITLNIGELASGIYTYTLYADGKKADSKQMIIIK